MNQRNRRRRRTNREPRRLVTLTSGRSSNVLLLSPSFATMNFQKLRLSLSLPSPSLFKCCTLLLNFEMRFFLKFYLSHRSQVFLGILSEHRTRQIPSDPGRI
uniref:Uncharacterized protein n=1 Tax=Opuntia streptacantha TaxID=393608 RepID=A0A7C9DTY4_OPUST